MSGDQSIGIIHQRLASALGMTEAQAAKVVQRLVPIVVAADVTRPEETDVFNERLCAGFGELGQTVGNFSHVQVFNPLTSGVIITLDLVYVSRTNQGAVSVRRHNTALSTASISIFRDRRVSGAPAAAVRQETVAAQQGTATLSFSIPAADATPIPIDWILQPGQGVVFVPSANNQGLSLNAWWTERRA